MKMTHRYTRNLSPKAVIFFRYAGALVLVGAATIICELLRRFLTPTNMVMPYLLAVVVAAIRLGLRPAVVTAALGVLTFDVFFVPPRFSFTVHDKEYLVTFLGLFTVGVVISSLVARAQKAQILEARENLERALLNSISHDLRTPLVTITGVLSSVLDEGRHLNETVRRDMLETARGEAERLNQFVQNLLDITRIEAGAVTLNIELCDVQDLIGCALAAVETRLGARDVRVSLSQDLPLVAMDMVLMNQVLINLLDNAVKYSPPGTPIDINVLCLDGWITITVSDRGPGIPESDLHRVFDKFCRINMPESTGGTGLGLSICKGIVEAHGGRVAAENRLEGGLTVTVEVPVKAQGKQHADR